MIKQIDSPPTYQIANLDSAITSCSRRAGWDSLHGPFHRLCILLDTSNGSGSSSSAARLASTTASTSLASDDRALVGGEDLIERLVELSRHLGEIFGLC